MKKIVKQVAGIDVSQDELVVQLASIYDDWVPEFGGSKTFANTQKGFDCFVEWVKKRTVSDVPVRYVMEATGVYHENLAYYLDQNDYEVSIVLPNKISNYVRTLETKTVTDRTASQAIALFGIERKLNRWSRPRELYKKLRQLTRERSQIVELSTICKNQLHAEQSEAAPQKSSIKRIQKRIELLKKQEKEIETELALLIKTDAEMQQLVLLLCSIPGIGLLTAATLLGETNGFDLIRNKRQLTSYAGLDVQEKQSGTSVRGKSRISKKGNKNLRKAMHFPALTAIRHDERFKAVYVRLVSKHGLKMKAVVAVQRKLLEMSFTVFKKQEKYDKDYFKKQHQQAEQILINN